MSSIKISELQPTGLELFQDSESFLNELNDQEIGGIKGGQVVSQETVTVEMTIVTETVVVNSTNVRQTRQLTPEEREALNKALDGIWQLFKGLF